MDEEIDGNNNIFLFAINKIESTFKNYNKNKKEKINLKLKNEEKISNHLNSLKLSREELFDLNRKFNTLKVSSTVNYSDNVSELISLFHSDDKDNMYYGLQNLLHVLKLNISNKKNIIESIVDEFIIDKLMSFTEDSAEIQLVAFTCIRLVLETSNIESFLNKGIFDILTQKFDSNISIQIEVI